MFMQYPKRSFGKTHMVRYPTYVYVKYSEKINPL